MKGFIAICVTAAAIVLQTGAVQSAPETPNIISTHTPSALELGQYVAKEKGFFAKRGLNVTITTTPENSTSIAAVVANSVQIVGPSPSVLLQAIDNSVDVVGVFGFYDFPTPTKVGLLASNALQIKTAKDLVGKKIGVPGFTGLQAVVLKRWLLENGVDLKDVTLITVPFQQMPDALRSGQIDATTAPDATYEAIVARKIGSVVIDFNSIIPPGTNAALYVTTTEFAKKNPQTLAAFRDSLQEAIDYMKDHQDEARTILGKYLRVPPEVLAATTVPTLSVGLKPEQLKWWVDVMLQQKMLQKDIDPKKAVFTP